MFKTDSLQGISAPKPRKIVVTYEEDEPLTQKSFSARIEELTERLQYRKQPEVLSAKDRFLRTVRKYSGR